MTAPVSTQCDRDRAFVAAAEALQPGGILAIDICDLEWGVARRDAPNLGRVGENWAIITEFSMPSPARFVRQIAVFVRNEATKMERGGVTTSFTTMCSSISPACRDCSLTIRLTRRSPSHSELKPCQLGSVRSSATGALPEWLPVPEHQRSRRPSRHPGSRAASWLPTVSARFSILDSFIGQSPDRATAQARDGRPTVG